VDFSQQAAGTSLAIVIRQQAPDEFVEGGVGFEEE
jgi:hypothetical protein